MKRGQAATEYILVAALILIILVPAAIMFMMNIKGSTENLSISKLYKIGNDIVNNAIEVYYQDQPAKITLKESFPAGLTNITVRNDWTIQPPVNELVFYVDKKGRSEEMVFISDVNIDGDFNENHTKKGVKNIILLANRTSTGIPYVKIEIQ